MRIGILGSGLMGGKLGTIFARAGHDVVFSYARSPNKLERLARDAGGKARAGSPREAAQQAEAVLVAVHWSRVDDVLQQEGNLSGDEGKAKQGRGHADPRRGLRSRRCRRLTDRAIHRAVRAARGRAGVRKRWWPGAGVPVRTV